MSMDKDFRVTITIKATTVIPFVDQEELNGSAPTKDDAIEAAWGYLPDGVREALQDEFYSEISYDVKELPLA